MKLICRKLGFFLLLFLLFLNKFSAQTCGGSFGAPIFTEDFGSVTTPLQMISPALVPPAFTNYIYSPKIPPSIVIGLWNLPSLVNDLNLGIPIAPVIAPTKNCSQVD